MALDPNRWTIKTQEVVTAAIGRAKDDSHPEVTPDHLLSLLLSQPEGVVLPILTKVDRQPGKLRADTEAALAALPKAYGSEARFSKQTNRVFDDADSVRRQLGDDYLSTEHLLLALANPDAGGATAARLDLSRTSCWPRSRRYAARTESPTRIPKRSSRRSNSTAATSPKMPARVDSIRSSGATRRSVGSSRSSPGGPRTTRSSSVNPASARPRSSRGSPSASSRATCRRVCATAG
ncbi:MAG: Clp protease N-terminal domain-containing protein [Acidimicrobiales bacterium]